MEWMEAKRLGLPLMHRSELLAHLMAKMKEIAKYLDI
jgi:UDP-N-acetylmuramate-alanine ligase